MSNNMEISDRTFSQPYGAAQLYPAPLYKYRNALSINLLYTVDGAGLQEMLPPGLELADADPVISAVVSAYPETPFGVYNEVWFYVRVKFEGQTFMFNPVIYVDSDSSMACGREVWGFPKKMATLSMRKEGNRMIFSGEKNGEKLIDVSFIPDEASSVPSMIGEISYPSLTCRLIPNRLGVGEPDIAQLIATSNPKYIRVDDQGNERRWLGQAEVSVGPGSPAHPVHVFKPKKFLQAWMSNYDNDLPAGVLVHDYKAAR
jgi:acetoacetate decarboxylase